MNSMAKIILNTIAPVQLVIEVNMNGSAHEHSWARLPKVGRFENWDQANSFAVRLEWEHPQGSGNWRFRYIQSGTSHTLVDANIAGSLKRYAQATIFLHCIFNVERNFSFSWWDQTPTSNARVVQVSYDYVTQAIHFGHQTKPPRMMAPTPLSTSSIKSKMMQLGLDGKREDMPTGPNQNHQATRIRRDFCVLVSSTLGRCGTDPTCISIECTNVCTN
jgi:hypothetical protein